MISKKKAIVKFHRLILKYVTIFDQHKIKGGRPRKFPIDFYIKFILSVLVDGLPWINLYHTVGNKTIFVGDMVRKCFYSWSSNKIFSNAYNELRSRYKKKVGIKTYKKLYIDSTVIPNGNGTKGHYAYKLPNKKSYKVTILCDDNKIIHANKFNNSSTHDSKLILETVNSTNVLKNTQIMGDCGYIAHKTVVAKLKKKKIELISCLRKNMKKKLSNEHKKLLKKRYLVEHTFSHLKRGYKRLSVIMDRNFKNLYSWFTIVNTIRIFSFLEKT